MWPEANRKLVSGPHGMPPAEVLETQRQRLLKAMTEVVTRKGYAGATIRDLLDQSGLSRRTFYDLYVDKEDCYLAAFRAVSDQLDDRLAAAFQSGATAGERLTLTIESLAGFCVDEPDAACAILVESLAAGQAGRDARNGLIERIAELLQPALDELRPIGPSSALVARATVGGIFELLYGPLARHDAERLRDLAEQIGELPLVPTAAR